MGVERDKTIAELLQAREAYERRDWADALGRLRGMTHRSSLASTAFPLWWALAMQPRA